MSKIMVLAPTGMGKSASLRTLPPKHTGIVNCDLKELPLRGHLKNYTTIMDPATGKVDWNKSNYIESASALAVLKAFQEWEKNPDILTIVIDTITHMITKEYMTNTVGKDFKAYQAMGKTFYDIIEAIRLSKKNVIVFGHIERKINEFGELTWEMKSHGKMITDLVPTSYFTTVLIGEVIKKDEKFAHVFRTQTQGSDPAKSPAYVDGADVKAALNSYEDNDMAVILEKLQVLAEEV